VIFLYPDYIILYPENIQKICPELGFRGARVQMTGIHKKCLWHTFFEAALGLRQDIFG
jgi:hypothetical protein